MSKQFLTVHILNTLPLHNLNRDQNGLPKSQMDGGVQRARLSAQSLKRAARSNYRGLATGTSMRTRDAINEVMAQADSYATERGLPFDAAAGRKAVAAVVKSLTNDADNDAKKAEAAARTGATKEKAGTLTFLARSEIATLARAVVDKQQNGTQTTLDDLVADATSPSLDIAAFGRMFAAQADLGTHAAIAVSHAATTHPMSLTADYFSAVEDAEQDHAGAAHIGMTYYTSGVYYRSFTLDLAQLRRSWSSFDAPGAPDDLADLLGCLIKALPTGKVNNTNSHALPTLVLAETQATRTAYEFDTPVAAGTDGGYKEESVRTLAAKRTQAVAFDPANFGEALVSGETFDADFAGARPVTTLDEVVSFMVEAAYADQPEHEAVTL